MTRQQKFEQLVRKLSEANSSGDFDAYKEARYALADYVWMKAKHVRVKSDSR